MNKFIPMFFNSNKYFKMSENNKFIENSWMQKLFKRRKHGFFNESGKISMKKKKRNLTKILKRTKQKFWN